MDDLKITVDQLKNYLGTGLKIEHCGEIHTFDGMYRNDLYISHKTKRGFHIPTHGPLETMKPICYRLSDLDKEIEHNGERFVPLDRLKDEFDSYLIGCVAISKGLEIQIEPFQDGGDVGDVFLDLLEINDITNLLFEWHLWPFGDEYFEQGLVIGKMRISKK